MYVIDQIAAWIRHVFVTDEPRLATACSRLKRPGHAQFTSPARLRDEPEPFRVHYKLTELGRRAAEYGEYDRPHTPKDAPVTGLAAEIREVFGPRRTWGDGKPTPKKGKKTR